MNKRKLFKRIGILLLLLIIILLAVAGYQKHKAAKEEAPKLQTFPVKKESSTRSLFFKGTINPIKNVAITTPVEGIVETLNFEYGNIVEKGQLLVALTSERLQEEYRTTFAEFLTAKQNYTNNTASLRGSRALYEAGVVSEEEFTGEEAQHDASGLQYLSAKYNLEKTLDIANKSSDYFEKFTLDNAKEIRRLLENEYGDLKIISPATGVALFPTQDSAPTASMDSQGSGSSAGQKLEVGHHIQEGQVIVSIGDLSGFSIKTDVDEVNVNRLKKGQKVTITGAAFPEITLHGVITSVGSQAQAASGGVASGGLADFPVTVQVPKITDKQRKIIHVGMNVKVELKLTTPPYIMIPVSAVTQKDGKNTVTVIDPKTQQQKDVLVKTGLTSISKVTILNGLKDGDTVVIHSKAAPND